MNIKLVLKVNGRQEVTKYCENDCRVLYLVIDKFSKLILNSYSVNIHNYPTLSSIAYRIFKTLFLKEKFKMQVGNRKKLVPMSDIPVVAELNYEIVKQAFFGGHCDMYIPTNPVGTNIYCYDVNSLYPFVMKEFPTKFIGFSNSLTIEQLEYLLVKDNIISLKQNKWFRDYVDSSVIIRETSYDSKATDNKRRIIFDSNNIMVNTKPIVLT